LSTCFKDKAIHITHLYWFLSGAADGNTRSFSGAAGVLCRTLAEMALKNSYDGNVLLSDVLLPFPLCDQL
jgi:hypothetical protein